MRYSSANDQGFKVNDQGSKVSDLGKGNDRGKVNEQGIKSIFWGKVNAVLSVCVGVWCVAESVAHNYLKPQVHQHLMR